MKKLGRIIKQRRSELKLTMRELANKAGVDRTYISKIESLGLIPTYHVLLKIEEALGIELQAFYFRKMAPNALVLSTEENLQYSLPKLSTKAKLFDLVNKLSSAPLTPSFQDTLKSIASYFPEKADDDNFAKEIHKGLLELRKTRNSIVHGLTYK
jgi:transcriptional regulator with XRE-family HTH domain